MEYLDRRRALVEERLETVLTTVGPPALASSVDHVTFAGGKRVRPTITVLACEALGGSITDAVDYAAGIELVHTASLVVDDIIDESPVRRGVDSAWAKYGIGAAIIASDGLLGEAFALFADDERALQIVSNAMVELGQGEAVELVDKPTSEREYRDLARRKTGALFRAAAQLGVVAANGSEHEIEALGEYAERVGVAFQMRDDILDATAEADVLGKPTGTDTAMDRPSVLEVTDLSPGEATDRAREEAETALAALDRIEFEDEAAGEYLAELAMFVVERDR